MSFHSLTPAPWSAHVPAWTLVCRCPCRKCYLWHLTRCCYTMHWATSTPDSHSCPALECSGPLPTLFPSPCLPAGREAAPSGRPSWACYTPTTSTGTWLHPWSQSTLSSRNLGVCVCVHVHVSQEITCLWCPSCLTQHGTYSAVVNAERMKESVNPRDKISCLLHTLDLHLLWRERSSTPGPSSSFLLCPPVSRPLTRADIHTT